MTEQEKTELLLEACDKIGSWLSAALGCDDNPDGISDEYREAIELWFSALGNFDSFTGDNGKDLRNGIKWPVATGIWGCARDFQNLLVNCWLRDGEFVIDQIGSDKERGIASKDGSEYSAFRPVAIYSPVDCPFYVHSTFSIP